MKNYGQSPSFTDEELARMFPDKYGYLLPTELRQTPEEQRHPLAREKEKTPEERLSSSYRSTEIEEPNILTKGISHLPYTDPFTDWLAKRRKLKATQNAEYNLSIDKIRNERSEAIKSNLLKWKDYMKGKYPDWEKRSKKALPSSDFGMLRLLEHNPNLATERVIKNLATHQEKNLLDQAKSRANADTVTETIMFGRNILAKGTELTSDFFHYVTGIDEFKELADELRELQTDTEDYQEDLNMADLRSTAGQKLSHENRGIILGIVKAIVSERGLAGWSRKQFEKRATNLLETAYRKGDLTEKTLKKIKLAEKNAQALRKGEFTAELPPIMGSSGYMAMEQEFSSGDPNLERFIKTLALDATMEATVFGIFKGGVAA